MRQIDRRGLLSGLLFLAAGAAGWVLARNYAMGTALRMGPGYVPLGLSLILSGFGALLILRSMLLADEKTGTWNIRAIGFVLAGVLAFAGLIETGGLVAAIVALTVIASMGSQDSRPIEVVIAAIVMALFGALLFVRGLQLPIQIWPIWLQS
ncbi:MAG: tripartite tricarboxylate transporter TctB family protein [Alphaproteobacteria bacterium]|nr:tripartite tricarboxylate transporter TctB family protein [Alphaproteobacteria bacterium]